MAIDKNSVAKEAQKYAAKGQFDKAIAEWKKLLKESPHDANLYNTIGDLCLKKNSKAEAVDAYRRAADILAQDGFTSKAIALYKKVLNIDNDQVEVHLALGDMNAEKGLTGNALENYKHVADLYTKQKDTVKALRVYQKMADLNPANLAFRIKLADMYAKQGMNAEATAAYLSAANVHIENNATTEARQLFEKILAFDPNNKDVYFKAGILYLKEGKFNEACRTLKPVHEANPADRELTDMYLDALARAGKDQEAEQVIKKSLAEEPGRTDLQEKLFGIFLQRKEYDGALDTAAALAAACMAREDRESAEGYLRKFIAACPHMAAGRRKLAEFYISIRRDGDAARSFLQAAELLNDEGDRDGAKEALDRALEIAPDLPEARTLTERLATEIAPEAGPQEAPQAEIREAPAEDLGFDVPPAEPAETAAEIPPAAAFAEPAAEAFSEAPAAAIVSELPVEPPAAAEPAAPAEDPAIMEAITEADVLVKYGLAMKAVEQLENLSKKFPDSVRIHTKLQNVYGDMGQMNRAAQHMVAIADIYERNGLQDEAVEELRSALAIDPHNPEIMSRLGIAPEQPPAVEPSETEPVAPPPVEPAFPEDTPPAPDVLAAHEPAPTDISMFDSLDTEAPEPREYAPPEPAFEEPLQVDTAPASEPEPGLRPAGEPAVTPGTSEFEIPEAAQQAEELQAGPEAEAPASVHAFAQPAPAAGPDIEELWAEAEFYYQQGLFDEAKKHYAKIIEVNPAESRAINRLSEISREEEDTREFTRLADAVENLEETIITETGAHELPLSASDEEAVRSLMSEIAEIKKPKPKPKPAAAPPPQMLEVEYVPPPVPEPEMPSWKTAAPPEEPQQEEERPFERFGDRKEHAYERPAQTPRPAKPQPPGRAPAKPTPPPAVEEEFFDLGEALKKETAAPAAAAGPKGASEDFFDLASELRDELSTIAMPSKPAAHAEEQSLDEIFEEFKRGVEQQTTKEESDTHYNLGVAYREMGLLDDAIEEFSLTPQGEQKFMSSRHMLGLCYMEKGEYTNAIREIDYALTYSEGMGEDEKSRVEMRYDLGLAYQGVGNINGALREFQIVQRVNPQHRDVAEKLKELKQGDTVSLTRLKGDIEKEISSKFLVEGERIEREEKSRKSERVRH